MVVHPPDACFRELEAPGFAGGDGRAGVELREDGMRRVDITGWPTRLCVFVFEADIRVLENAHFRRIESSGGHLHHERCMRGLQNAQLDLGLCDVHSTDRSEKDDDRSRDECFSLHHTDVDRQPDLYSSGKSSQNARWSSGFRTSKDRLMIVS